MIDLSGATFILRWSCLVGFVILLFCCRLFVSIGPKTLFFPHSNIAPPWKRKQDNICLSSLWDLSPGPLLWDGSGIVVMLFISLLKVCPPLTHPQRWDQKTLWIKQTQRLKETFSRAISKIPTNSNKKLEKGCYFWHFWGKLESRSILVIFRAVLSFWV